MKKFRIYFFLTSAAIGGCVSARAQYASANHSVDTLINHQMKALHIPGMAVAVVKEGKIIKMSTYGLASMEWNQPVGPHTCFQIASCTKLLTSTLLLKTIKRGLIDLDDPVSKYLDSVPVQWEQIRIKHLITHTSGIGNYNGDMYASTTDVVRTLKDSALDYSTGTSQHYSQYDFMVLGYILEKIYKKPFIQLLKDEVAAPLGMQDGAFDREFRVGQYLRTDIIREKATTYYEWEGKRVAYKFIYPQYTYTAGAYFASISDLAHWAVGLDKEILFTRKFSEDLIFGRDSLGNKLSDFTRAGWPSADESGFIAAGHSGGPGLGDILRFSREGYTFIVLSNDGELLPGFARAIASYYIKELPERMEFGKFDRQ